MARYSSYNELVDEKTSEFEEVVDNNETGFDRAEALDDLITTLYTGIGVGKGSLLVDKALEGEYEEVREEAEIYWENNGRDLEEVTRKLEGESLVPR